MEYLGIYFLFGFVSYISLVIYEIWKLWPVERRTIAKPMALVKQAILIMGHIYLSSHQS